MQTLRILPVVLAAALCSSVMAQPPLAIKRLSGEFRLNSGLDLTHSGIVPFSAQLFSRTGQVCQLGGKLRVHDGKPAQVETVPGATFIHCPGAAPALVTGHVIPALWAPPQSRRCRSYIGKYNNTCSGYSVTVSAGAPGMWITWHALTSEQASPDERISP